MNTMCATSRTPLRRLIVRLFPGRPPWWLSSRTAWKLYGFLDWAACRAEDVALALEDEETR